MKKKIEVTATPNGVVSKTDAPMVCKELERIAAKHGGHLPEESVLKTAEPEDSKLHKYFTWEDSEAASLFRLQEARQLIRSVSVVIQPAKGDNPPVLVRAFLNVEPKEGEERFDRRTYMPVAQVMSDEQYRQQVLNRAYNELVAWRDRYQHLKEFSAVCKVIEQVEETVAA